MNSAPEWQDGECCFRCRSEFSIVARKHHCRNCGNVFCAKCSSQQIPIPKFGIDKSVRVCDDCYDNLAPHDSNNEPSTTNGRPTSIPALDSISTSSSATINSTAPVSTAKTPASASAPSEQELKEEEEIQLALALSLSEAEAPVRSSAKISFPDFKQPEPSVVKVKENVVPVTADVLTTPSCSSLIPNNPSPEEEDTEVFKFVAELQSNAEVFVNRINSNKLRGRPIANDTAIQSKFLNLTNMHSKLLEYIKNHEEQRAFYEGLQDKLTQIHDARAALDALREEHQEKIRLAAEEAERNRQNQLAHKLELMRQKKSQMLQYQRDMAMQRMQEQEMEFMMRQDNQEISTTGAMQALPQAAIQGQTQASTQLSMQTSSHLPMQQASTQVPMQISTQVSMQTSPNVPISTSHAPIQTSSHIPSQTSIQVQRDSIPTTTPSFALVEEAPLISFDD